MGTFWQDIRYAVRTLVKKPGFTSVAILSLTLGIGANTTIFTLVKAIFLQGIPVKDPSQVVVVFSTQQSRGGAVQQFLPITVLNGKDYRDQNDVFSATSVVVFAGAPLTRNGKDTPAFVELVNHEHFGLLGVHMMQGRDFTPDDDRTDGRNPVAIISYAKWNTDFGSDPKILGQTVILNSQSFTVIGVTPPEFQNVATLGSPDFWIPTTMHDLILTGIQKDWYNQRTARIALAVARLKPNVTLAQAAVSMHALGNRLAQEYPTENKGRNNDLVPLDQTNIPPQQRSLFVRAGALMMITVGLVLLIACANVANLLLTRATQRRREIAVRLSLGASRGRIIRQLLTESFVIGLAAGGLAILTANWAKRLILGLIPGGPPQGLDTSTDVRVLLFTLALALFAATTFGLVPALQASSPQQMSALRDRTDAPGGATRWYGVRGVLVMAQVTLSLVALVGAGLFIHSLKNAQEIDPGFEVKHELAVGINVGLQHYDQARGEQFYRESVERIDALPVVANAAISDTPPFSQSFQRTTFPEGVDTSDLQNGKLTPTISVSPGFFGAAGITLLRGREFDDHDDAQAHMVAVVNQAFVDRTWPGQDPLGKHLRFALQTWDVEVVGLVRTVKYQTLGEPPQPIVYFPLKQHYTPAVTMFVRTKGDPNAALGDVRATLQGMDPTIPLRNFQAVQTALDQTLGPPKVGAELLGAFGGLALLLASIGTYGVMSYSVSQRTQEIGIRMALGAQRGDVLTLILRNGMAMVGAGIVAGLLLSIALTNSMNSLLFGIGLFDAASFGATAGILLIVAMIACYLPARRAMRVDPIIALRYE
ncbi:MAG: ABC transporter permease [Candidatus Acidiferrales bacterium]